MLKARSIPAALQNVKNLQKRSVSGHSKAAELPFSIYFHWPYCESKCTYCNFNKYINPTFPPNERMLSAIKRELAFYMRHPKFGLQARKLHSIYFGGGTPTLAPVFAIQSVIEEVDKIVGGLPNDIEITIEGNPTSSEVNKLQSLHNIGVNRLSLGIQSLRNEDLPVLGRDHTAKDAIHALESAKRIFGERGFTFDMIFGRPGNSLDDWKKELKQALCIAGDHMSIYQLTLERGTPLYKDVIAGKLAPIAGQEEIADMYEHVIEATAEHGYFHYEVSNYARTRTAMSRHNFAYWRGMDYIGVGPGAHGRLTQVDGDRLRTFGEFHPERWMAQCEEEGDGVRKMISMKPYQIPEELVLFGLRTKLGIPRSRFSAMTGGKQLEDTLQGDVVKSYVEHGLLINEGKKEDEEQAVMPEFVPVDCFSEFRDGTLRPTEKGLAVIDTIIPNILKPLDD
ncbi:radical S-adenosyl methionine domain-containing protein 1 [Umbelopsis sp. PMI_123]|nr:radical S-adenosyl methionine domain-containing protein 1 [Umbelopsis sp. PMI_123]